MTCEGKFTNLLYDRALILQYRIPVCLTIPHEYHNKVHSCLPAILLHGERKVKEQKIRFTAMSASWKADRKQSYDIWERIDWMNEHVCIISKSAKDTDQCDKQSRWERLHRLLFGSYRLKSNRCRRQSLVAPCASSSNAKWPEIHIGQNSLGQPTTPPMHFPGQIRSNFIWEAPSWSQSAW